MLMCFAETRVNVCCDTGWFVHVLVLFNSACSCRNGRISMAGVNTHNVARLAEAMHTVTK